MFYGRVVRYRSIQRLSLLALCCPFPSFFSLTPPPVPLPYFRLSLKLEIVSSCSKIGKWSNLKDNSIITNEWYTLGKHDQRYSGPAVTCSQGNRAPPLDFSYLFLQCSKLRSIDRLAHSCVSKLSRLAILYIECCVHNFMYPPKEKTYDAQSENFNHHSEGNYEHVHRTAPLKIFCDSETDIFVYLLLDAQSETPSCT